MESVTEEVEQEHRGLMRSIGRALQPAEDQSFEDKMMHHAGLTLIFGAVFCYKIISTGYVSARVFNGEPTSYPFNEIPGILWRATHNPFDPNAAWEPVNTGGAVPGPLAFWATFVALFVIHYLVVAIPLYALNRTWSSSDGGGSSDGSWADDKVVRSMLLDRKTDPADEDKLVVGQRNGKNVAIDRSLSMLVVGPLHSGKTNALSIPTLLEWNGPALVVVSKGHLIDQTINWRRERGLVRVFDPAAASRYERSGWVMVEDCGNWDGAIAMAQHLRSAVYGSIQGRRQQADESGIIGLGTLWSDSLAMALAPYLYAAAVKGANINQVTQWIIQHERDEVLRILEPVDEQAAAAHEAAFYRRDETMDTFFHHIYDMLSVYGDPVVAASATKRDIVPANLLGGRHETLYLYAPEHDQARFQPLFTMIVRQTLAAVNQKYAASGQPLRSPLLVVVDGAVGIASIKAVSQMASTGRAKGVEMLTVFEEGDWHDGQQGGNATATLLENHHALMVMNGNWRGHGETTSLAGWPGLTDELAPDEAALFYDHYPPIRVRLRKWQDDERLRARVEDPESAIRPPASQDGSALTADSPEYTLVEQTSAWRRRRRSADHSPSTSGAASNGRSRSSSSRSRNVFRPDAGASSPGHQGSAADSSQYYRPN